jgi:hypothetical protein
VGGGYRDNYCWDLKLEFEVTVGPATWVPLFAWVTGTIYCAAGLFPRLGLSSNLLKF